ncbi:MAG TPA: glycosyltransferase [Opitutae bacterium]|nr:glycosyltransferase [Opitutae bacterium]
MKISIITATYNSEAHLEACLKSIYTQSGDIEHIVIDGGSTDGTLAILDKYRDEISYLISEPDDGISSAFNKGIAQCSGSLVGIVSSDDYLMPGAINKIEEDWKQNGEVDVLYGDVVFDEGTDTKFIVKPDTDLSVIWKRQPLKHASVFVRTEVYQDLGGFDSKWRCAMDYDLILRFYTNQRTFRYLPVALAAVRPGGFSYDNLGKTMRETCQIAESYGASKISSRLNLIRKYLRVQLRALVLTKGFRRVLMVYRKRSSRFEVLPSDK